MSKQDITAGDELEQLLEGIRTWQGAERMKASAVKALQRLLAQREQAAYQAGVEAAIGALDSLGQDVRPEITEWIVSGSREVAEASNNVLDQARAAIEKLKEQQK